MSDWHRQMHVFMHGEESWRATQAAAASLPVDKQQLEGGVFRVGDRVVRVFTPNRSLAAVEGDAAVLHHVEAHGFPAERVVEVTAIEGCPALVTTFVEGAKATPDPETVRALGDLLGRLHTMPVPEGLRPAGVLHHWAPDGGGVEAGKASAHRWLDVAAERVQGDDVARLDALRARVDGMDDLAGLPRAVLHPDFSHDNAIAGPVLVDWSGAGEGARVHGLMTLLLLAVFRNPSGPQPALADAALAGYREHVQLTDEEVERVGASMRYGDPIGDAFGVGAGFAQLIFVVSAWQQPNRMMDLVVERLRQSST